MHGQLRAHNYISIALSIAADKYISNKSYV